MSGIAVLRLFFTFNILSFPQVLCNIIIFKRLFFFFLIVFYGCAWMLIYFVSDYTDRINIFSMKNIAIKSIDMTCNLPLWIETDFWIYFFDFDLTPTSTSNHSVITIYILVHTHYHWHTCKHQHVISKFIIINWAHNMVMWGSIAQE